MIFKKILFFILFFSLFLNLSAQGKIKVYDLGRVKEGEIVNEEIPLERKPQSIISGCECLKVSFKEGKSVLQVNLDTSGYKGETHPASERAGRRYRTDSRSSGKR